MKERFQTELLQYIKCSSFHVAFEADYSITIFSYLSLCIIIIFVFNFHNIKITLNKNVFQRDG